MGLSLSKYLLFFLISIKAPLKRDEQRFLFDAKSSFRSWGIHVFVLPFSYVEKQLDKRATVNFKISDVTDWTETIATHIAQYLNK